MLTLVVCIVILALVFDYINGFHDAANSIATVVSTRVMTPKAAVGMAAFFNFVAFFVFHQGVAKTIKSGVVSADAITIAVVASGLLSAITWNLITWYYGIPSSSSHALVGGYAGAAVMKGGWKVLNSGGLMADLILHGRWNTEKITIIDIGAFILVAPVLGVILGFTLMLIIYWLFRRSPPSKVSTVFRKAQLLSASAYSLGHGGNDAQKTAGIIAAVLLAGGYLKPHEEIPMWVVFSCYAAMGLGTMGGGWRIVKTMGQKICLLQPVNGFCAEMAGSITLFLATFLKIPVSTTHTITGAIVGVGCTRGLHAVKWGVAGRVVWAWILTIPISATIAALLYFPLSRIIKF
jgi:inorganic phosphate transporter, PiT family